MKNYWKTLLAGILVAGTSGAIAEEIVLNGAGASFPAPVYQNWTYTYSQSSQDVQINYQSIGSGAGINQLKSKTIDFAGSDNPLTQEDLVQEGFVQLPMLTGGVVVIVNLPNIGNNQLKLDKSTLADIFLGKITRWDDAKIKELNPQLKLPKLKITVVRRADASGTSFIFTNYLSKISPTWEQQVGSGSSVKWPVGIGGQKNPGVCNNIAKIRGSIGYTEYTYAIEAKLSCVQLQNAAGQYVSPTPDTFRASSASADWKNAPGFYMILTNQPGESSWPITGVTYLLYRKDAPAETKKALNDYIRWCFSTGKAAAEKLHYVPLPENVVKMLEEQVLN